jgi:hypothetical protein
LAALLRNFFGPTSSSPGSDAPKDKDGLPTGRFASGVDHAQSPRKRNERFAKRKETFRILGRKSLESLCEPNQ